MRPRKAGLIKRKEKCSVTKQGLEGGELNCYKVFWCFFPMKVSWNQAYNSRVSLALALSDVPVTSCFFLFFFLPSAFLVYYFSFLTSTFYIITHN